jgi:hypothetical protein
MFVYKISSGHDIAEILRMLALNTNQSIKDPMLSNNYITIFLHKN